jgi:hypothetical protein
MGGQLFDGDRLDAPAVPLFGGPEQSTAMRTTPVRTHPHGLTDLSIRRVITTREGPVAPRPPHAAGQWLRLCLGPGDRGAVLIWDAVS